MRAYELLQRVSDNELVIRAIEKNLASRRNLVDIRSDFNRSEDVVGITWLISYTTFAYVDCLSCFYHLKSIRTSTNTTPIRHPNLSIERKPTFRTSDSSTTIFHQKCTKNKPNERSNKRTYTFYWKAQNETRIRRKIGPKSRLFFFVFLSGWAHFFLVHSKRYTFVHRTC